MARPGSHLSLAPPPPIIDNGWLAGGLASGRMGTGGDITATVRYIYFVVAVHCSMSFYLRGTSLTE